MAVIVAVIVAECLVFCTYARGALGVEREERKSARSRLKGLMVMVDTGPIALAAVSSE